MADDEFQALIRLLRKTSAEAVPAAEMAAAEVYRQAIQAAAPKKKGQLAASVKVIEGKPMGRSLTGTPARRLFVGPEKRKGYYGYFVEKGWTSVGSRRRQRKGTTTTHSQKGLSGGTKIPGRPWLEPAVRAAERRAINAAQLAFDEKTRELDS